MNGHSNSRAMAGEVMASLVLLLSAIWLPWATYRSATLDMNFRSGGVGLVLLACGVGTLTLVGVSLVWSGAGIHWLQLFLGATANRTIAVHPGYSTTAYGIGAGLAFAASVVLVVSSVVQLKSNQGPEGSESHRASGAAAIR